MTIRLACKYPYFFIHLLYIDVSRFRIRVRFVVDGKNVVEHVKWFSEESDRHRNSVVRDAASEIVRKHCRKFNLEAAIVGFYDFLIFVASNVDEEVELTLKVEERIRDDLKRVSALEHKLEHLNNCLGTLTFDQLFDDCAEPNRLDPITLSQRQRNPIVAEEIRKQLVCSSIS